MPWNILILPLVAGYFLLSFSKIIKYRTKRLDKQRLVFESAIVGFFILALSFLIRFGVEQINPQWISDIYAIFPFKTQFIGTTSASLIGTIILVVTVNLFLDDENAINRTIKNRGNTLEQMIRTSFKDGKMLQFTLDTGKVYVAIVKETYKPDSNYVRVCPVISGYRTEDQLVKFTTSYEDVFENHDTDKLDMDVDLIITIDNVVTVGYFDAELYQEFNTLDAST